jgi:hypothetical protein
LVCKTLFAVSCFALSLPAFSQVSIAGHRNITAQADSSGRYAVTFPDLKWTFSGTVGVPLINLQTRSGADAAGGYSEIVFDFVLSGERHAAIRSYHEQPAVLFTLSNLSAVVPNTFAFPNWTEYPNNLEHVTFNGIFAPPTTWGFATDSPWVFFDGSGKTFILSAASNFMTASTNWGSNKEMQSGIAREITTLPRGFEHRTVLVAEPGVNRAFDTWGRTLTALGGKMRPANDADITLAKVSYWTDNGAPYYYRMADSMNYEQTLIAVKNDFDRAGIALGSLQLDSWFYPKGSAAQWGNNGEGIYRYEAAAPPFMQGLARFQQRVGVPLITHARWIDPSSPYRTLYKMSGNVITDPAFWENTAGYLAESGVATFEQDWLADKAHTDFNLTDGDAFLDNMASAMLRRNLTMQYCMAGARHYLQSSKYSNLTTIRTSGDHLQRERWIDFLYGSRLAGALGAWPFTDNFRSGETSQILIATLSAGPLGIADPIGSLHVANLLRAVRRDGVIVKPDVPLTPTDASYTALARNADTPQIASTWSDFGEMRTSYVFAFAHGTNTRATFRPADLGMNGKVYVHNYFAGSGQVVNAEDVIDQSISGEQVYLVLAPFGRSGIAILGDTDHFVTMGKKRVSAFTDDGKAQLTVTFVSGERTLSITGYSPSDPLVEGAAGPVEYNEATHMFRIPVAPGQNGSATLRIHQSPIRLRQRR